jgi:hypothetical protein
MSTSDYSYFLEIQSELSLHKISISTANIFELNSFCLTVLHHTKCCKQHYYRFKYDVISLLIFIHNNQEYTAPGLEYEPFTQNATPVYRLSAEFLLHVLHTITLYNLLLQKHESKPERKFRLAYLGQETTVNKPWHLTTHKYEAQPETSSSSSKRRDTGSYTSE